MLEKARIGAVGINNVLGLAKGQEHACLVGKDENGQARKNPARAAGRLGQNQLLSGLGICKLHSIAQGRDVLIPSSGRGLCCAEIAFLLIQWRLGGPSASLRPPASGAHSVCRAGAQRLASLLSGCRLRPGIPERVAAPAVRWGFALHHPSKNLRFSSGLSSVPIGFWCASLQRGIRFRRASGEEQSVKTSIPSKHPFYQDNQFIKASTS